MVIFTYFRVRNAQINRANGQPLKDNFSLGLVKPQEIFPAHNIMLKRPEYSSFMLQALKHTLHHIPIHIRSNCETFLESKESTTEFILKYTIHGTSLKDVVFWEKQQQQKVFDRGTRRNALSIESKDISQLTAMFMLECHESGRCCVSEEERQKRSNRRHLSADITLGAKK